MSRDSRSSDHNPDDDPMQALIGKQLRTLYDSVLTEPIPDKLVNLLAQLDDIDVPGERSPKKPDSTDDQ